MMRRPTLFLTVGLPCTGKTTAARRIEVEQNALRLTKDEWVKALYGHENPPSAQDVIEGRLIEIGLRALELGNNVVIDYGLWGRDERSALRQAAADLGAMVEMRYFELTPPSSGDDLISAKPKRRTRPGPCPTRNSPSGLPSSTSRRQESSTAVNLSMTHRLDSRHGTSGAGIAGRPRSPDSEWTSEAVWNDRADENRGLDANADEAGTDSAPGFRTWTGPSPSMPRASRASRRTSTCSPARAC